MLCGTTNWILHFEQKLKHKLMRPFCNVKTKILHRMNALNIFWIWFSSFVAPCTFLGSSQSWTREFEDSKFEFQSFCRNHLFWYHKTICLQKIWWLSSLMESSIHCGVCLLCPLCPNKTKQQGKNFPFSSQFYDPSIHFDKAVLRNHETTPSTRLLLSN